MVKRTKKKPKKSNVDMILSIQKPQRKKFSFYLNDYRKFCILQQRLMGHNLEAWGHWIYHYNVKKNTKNVAICTFWPRVNIATQQQCSGLKIDNVVAIANVVVDYRFFLLFFCCLMSLNLLFNMAICALCSLRKCQSLNICFVLVQGFVLLIFFSLRLYSGKICIKLHV